MIDKVQHAPLGPSGAERWMTCSGSPNASVGLPDRQTIYGATGTAAHAVAAMCLREDRQAIEFLDREIEIEIEGFEKILCDEEMVNGVQQYADLCREAAADCLPELIWIEERVNPGAGEADLDELTWGTGDFACYNHHAFLLTVIDFKYGTKSVSAVGNPQIRSYALGFVKRLVQLHPNIVIERVRLQICQPRDAFAGSTEVWEEITLDDLLDWADQYYEAARRTFAPDAPLVAGEHCLFCRAAGACEEHRRWQLNNVIAEFQEPAAVPSGFLDPDTLTPEQFGQVLTFLDGFAGWVKEVRRRAFDLINAGVEIPCPEGGLWRIKERFGHRKFTDPENAAICFALDDDLPFDELWAPRKLKSPAQIEASYKKLHGAKEAKRFAHKVAELVERPVSSVTLARPNDPTEGLLGAQGFEKLD